MEEREILRERLELALLRIREIPVKISRELSYYPGKNILQQ